MNIMATPFYAALLGLMYVLLSALVIRQRRSAQISLGSKNNDILQKRVRTHANFAEYIPFSLLLIWFLETTTYASNLAHILGILLIVGRLLHAYGMLANKAIQYRVWGMLLTFAVITVAALRLLWHAFPL